VTIRKGQDWGAPGPLPDDGVVVRSDAEAREAVTAARREGRPAPALGLLDGDLCRTLGGTGDEARLRSPQAMTFPCDLGAVLLDGRLHWFVASLVARGPWWRGRAWLAMNAAWLGDWNVAPRAHPDDGLLDTFDARIPAGQRPAVRRRLPLGAHLPHPAIAERRAGAAQIRLERPLPVWLDGTAVGEARDLSVRVEPDALTIVV
jgi:hypothetical protein